MLVDQWIPCRRRSWFNVMLSLMVTLQKPADGHGRLGYRHATAD
jgi:hypothetical protein